MATFGYTLMCEQLGPKELVRNGVDAERAGFDFTVISDHFHPWLEEQGESPFAWSVLGAVASQTSRMQLMTMVTCPIVRYHPAIVAQMAATIGLMSDDRFTLGLGAGENLNEHVVGKGWPPANIRHLMLEEAIDIIRDLWKGGYVSHQGDFFAVHDARIFSLPKQLPPIAVAASGRESCRLAARMGAGLIATQPYPELVKMYRDAGGTGPRYAQIAVCWGRDEAQARKTAHRYFRFAVPAWKVQSELPNPVNFAAASITVREEDVAALLPCGPSVDRHLEGIQQFLDAGFERIAFLQAGRDQEGFFGFWNEELKPRLEKMGLVARRQETAAPAAGRSSR
jgi:G6PDH family F420-dependent oxidoreductase